MRNPCLLLSLQLTTAAMADTEPIIPGALISSIARERRTAPCASPPHRQFDFWVGDWDCSWDGGNGTNKVTAELDGMVILERFDGHRRFGCPGGPRQQRRQRHQ